MKQTLLFLYTLLFVLSTTHGQDTESFASAATQLKTTKQLDSLILEIKSTLGDSSSVLGLAYHKLGVAHYKKKQYTEAINATKLGLEARQKALEPQHHDLGQSHLNLGFFHRKLQHPKQAITHIEAAATIWSSQNHPKFLEAYRQLANIYKDFGDYERAIHYYQLAFEKGADLVGNYEAQFARLSNDMAIVYGELQQSENAIKQLELSQKYYENNCHSILVEGNLANSHNNIGLQYLALDKPREALYSFYESYAINKERKGREEEEIEDLVNFGFGFRETGQVEEAIAVLQTALKKCEILPDADQSKVAAMVHNNSGDAYLAAKRYQEGIDHYLLAIKRLVPEKFYTDLPRKEQLNLVYLKKDVLTYLEDLAGGYNQFYKQDQNRNHLLEALKVYQLADHLIDQIRFENQEQRSRLFWRNQTRPIYESAIETCYLLDKPKEAYYFFEKSRAVLLLDEINHDKALAFSSIPDSLLNLEVESRKVIADLEYDLFQSFSKNDHQEISSIRQDLLDKKKEYESLLLGFEEQFPAFLQYKNSWKVPDLRDAKSYLSSNGAELIAFMNTDSAIYALQLSNWKTALHHLGSNQQAKLLTNELLSSLTHRQGSISKLTNAASELYQQLIAPIGWTKNRLIIIGDSYLNYLPFEVLLQEKDDRRAETLADRYLLNDKTINYAYSMSVLLENKREVPSEARGFLAVAPVNFPEAGLPKLKRSEAQVIELGELLNGQVLLKKEATKTNFLEAAIDKQVLHLSTHAIAGEQPSIFFYEDTLTLSELYTQQFSADLVVLSTCESGTGNLEKGEGVMSLARGFCTAGVPATLTSLWSVDERATQLIMSNFYNQLNKGDTQTEALQAAKLDFLHDSDILHQHPYYWAGFIHVGASDRLSLSGKPGWVWAMAALIFMLLILWIFKPENKPSKEKEQ